MLEFETNLSWIGENGLRENENRNVLFYSNFRSEHTVNMKFTWIIFKDPFWERTKIIRVEIK